MALAPLPGSCLFVMTDGSERAADGQWQQQADGSSHAPGGGSAVDAVPAPSGC